MRKLFDDNRPMALTAEVVRQLEGFGYKAEVVRKWSAAKATIVLDSAKREQAIALERAAEKARAQDRPKPIGGPLPMLRLHAASYLSEPMSPNDLTQAVMYSIHELDGSEIVRLAGYLVTLFRANNGFSPDNLRRAAEKAGGDRGTADAQQENTPAGTGGAERPRSEGRGTEAAAGMHSAED